MQEIFLARCRDDHVKFESCTLNFGGDRDVFIDRKLTCVLKVGVVRPLEFQHLKLCDAYLGEVVTLSDAPELKLELTFRRYFFSNVSSDLGAISSQHSIVEV